MSEKIGQNPLYKVGIFSLFQDSRKLVVACRQNTPKKSWFQTNFLLPIKSYFAKKKSSVLINHIWSHFYYKNKSLNGNYSNL